MSGRSLSPEELEHLQKEGYVIVKAILTQADFEPIERDYSALIEAKAEELLRLGVIKDTHEGAAFDKRLALIAEQCSDQDFEKHITTFGLALDTMYARQRGLFEFFFSPRLTSAISSVPFVGSELTLSPIQHCRPFLPSRNGKQTRAGAATLAPWHQDQGVTREEADASDILTCWIPMTDVVKETGCLQLIPRRTECGLLPHIKSDYGTTIDPSVLPSEEEALRIDCEMSKGDLLLMHKFTPHRSQPNLTRLDGVGRFELKVRWSLDLRFQTTGTPTGRHFWPEFILLSANRASVQDDFDEWCRRWETDLANSEGERWHRVASDIGGSIGGEPTHTAKRLKPS